MPDIYNKKDSGKSAIVLPHFPYSSQRFPLVDLLGLLVGFPVGDAIFDERGIDQLLAVERWCFGQVKSSVKPTSRKCRDSDDPVGIVLSPFISTKKHQAP